MHAVSYKNLFPKISHRYWNIKCNINIRKTLPMPKMSKIEVKSLS